MGNPKTETFVGSLAGEKITRTAWQIADGLEMRRAVDSHQEVVAEGMKLPDGTVVQPLGTYRGQTDEKGVMRRTLEDVRGFMITTPGPDGHEVCVVFDKKGHVESFVDRYHTENGDSVKEIRDKDGKLTSKRVTEFGEEKGSYRIRYYDADGKQTSEECSRNWKGKKEDTSKNEKKSRTPDKKSQRQFGNGKGLDDRLGEEQKKNERIARRAATRRKHPLR